jgi:hypothetical protein
MATPLQDDTGAALTQFGVGARPGVNSKRMRGIWNFLNAIAHGGSGSVVKADDALAVSGAGIGTTTCTQMATSVDNYLTSGNYFDPGSLTNSPFGANGAMISISRGPFFKGMQFALCVVGSQAGQIAFRFYSAGYGAWNYVYLSTVGGPDGNDGQPPAPKAVTGSVSVADYVFRNFLEMTNALGIYRLYAYKPASAGMCCAGDIMIDSSGAMTFRLSYNGIVDLEIQAGSGRWIQARQNLGSAQTIQYSLVKIL